MDSSLSVSTLLLSNVFFRCVVTGPEGDEGHLLGDLGHPCLEGGLLVFSKTHQSQSACRHTSSAPETLNRGFMLLTN